MSDIEFDTDTQARKDFTSREASNQSQTPGMAAWLIRKGIIKDESSASAILVGIVIFDFIVAAALIYFFVLK